MKFVGVKQGMLNLFGDTEELLPCTAIKVEKHVVSQVKTLIRDGYSAVQLASLNLSPSAIRKMSKPQIGHYKKAGVTPRRVSFEFRVSGSSSYDVGMEIGLESMENLLFVDVRGKSKGKGHQGVMKRYNFAGGPASHGSGFHRHGGSCGMRSTPGRCLPKQKKSGRMGDEWVTVQSLPVVKVDLGRGLLWVKGSIPGPRGGVVYLAQSLKKAKVSGVKRDKVSRGCG